MKANDIIYQGTEVKYAISIDGLNMAADPFEVTLTWGMMGKTLTLRKQDMTEGADGMWYFMFPTDRMVGVVIAECRYDVPDTDFADGFRRETDRQALCFVAATSRPQLVCCPSDDGHTVHYERTMEGNLGDFDLLTDKNGLLLLTADGKYLAVQKGIINN